MSFFSPEGNLCFLPYRDKPFPPCHRGTGRRGDGAKKLLKQCVEEAALSTPHPPDPTAACLPGGCTGGSRPVPVTSPPTTIHSPTQKTSRCARDQHPPTVHSATQVCCQPHSSLTGGHKHRLCTHEQTHTYTQVNTHAYTEGIRYEPKRPLGVDTSKEVGGASLMAQWLRISLPMQGTRVRALVWEDPTCRGATRPVSHNY